MNEYEAFGILLFLLFVGFGALAFIAAIVRTK